MLERTNYGIYTIKDWVRSQNIRDVVRPYVELDHRGRGHCYHGERHNHNDAKPSFTVSDRRQSWRCWREEVGGDAFDFLCFVHDVDKREMYARLKHTFYSYR